jgi:hypothetical protein
MSRIRANFDYLLLWSGTGLARQLMFVQEIASLTEIMRSNNTELEITGLLLYTERLFQGRPEGHFIPMLEGPEAP